MAPLLITNNVIVSDTTTIRPSELHVKNSKEYNKFDENEMKDEIEMKDLNWQNLLPKSSSDQLENRTYPMQIQTAFRIDDYSGYDQESDISDNNNKSNQMLPIYCSIMGLIIISLLCYVVYKLWRQREASKNAKLTDSYNSNKTDLLDRTSCLDNNHLQHRRISSGFINNNNNAHLPNHSPQSTTELNNTINSTPDNDINNHLQFNDIIVGHEKAPLLGKLDHSNSSFSNFEQKPISVIPMNILGVICYRLSQHGWQELANIMDLETSKFDQLPSEVTSDLLSAAMEAQNTVESHLKLCNQDNSNTIQSITNNNPKNNLTMTVSMFQYMCLQNTVNLGQLMNSLQKLNRSDLVALIQQHTGIIKSKKSINHSNEEYKDKTKSMKSKENFQIEN